MRLHLNIDDTVRWFGYVNVDCRNRSPPAQSVSLPPRKVHRTDHHDDEDCEDGIHESWNPTSEMERATELEDLLDELEEFDDELMKLAVVRTSFDVTELEQVTDPAEFMAELKAFETLRDELVDETATAQG
ncbi:hypothetical protein MPER_04079 [Moniliophthora perniciosa FA553]|nr:hypothetical protein MPER_04079 [Moniliophthora perniciosa FA553]